MEPLPLGVVGESETLLALAKPAGLPIHPGTGHSDNLAGRLRLLYPDAPFPPTPAHRLDKDTSGLVLAAKTFEGLGKLHTQFREKLIEKTYLTWVAGVWKDEEPLLLEDRLEKQGKTGKELMKRAAVGRGKTALAEVRPLQRKRNATLLAGPPSHRPDATKSGPSCPCAAIPCWGTASTAARNCLNRSGGGGAFSCTPGS